MENSDLLHCEDNGFQIQPGECMKDHTVPSLTACGSSNMLDSVF